MLFFSADDGLSGVELWKRRLAGRHGDGEGHPAGPDGELARPARRGGLERLLPRQRRSPGWSSGRATAPAGRSWCATSRRAPELHAAAADRGERPSHFTVSDGITGAELWKSDGTAPGTALVRDIAPGIGGSSPSLATCRHEPLLRRADNAQGLEPWLLPPAALPTAIPTDSVTRPSSGSARTGRLRLGQRRPVRRRRGVHVPHRRPGRRQRRRRRERRRRGDRRDRSARADLGAPAADPRPRAARGRRARPRRALARFGTGEPPPRPLELRARIVHSWAQRPTATQTWPSTTGR